MAGIGGPELIVLGVLAMVVGGGFATIDAVSRPAGRYVKGSKGAWLAVLLCTNPLLTRWVGGLFWMVTLPAFTVASIAYLLTNRRGNPTPRPAWVWLVGTLAFAGLIAVNAAILLIELRAAVPPPNERELIDAPDAAMIIEMHAAGTDLSKPHAVAFLLFLPDEAAAARVARTLRAQGFAVELRESVGGGQWQARGTRMMLLDEAELVRLRGEFDALARSEGGEYGGWRAPLVGGR